MVLGRLRLAEDPEPRACEARPGGTLSHAMQEFASTPCLGDEVPGQTQLVLHVLRRERRGVQEGQDLFGRRGLFRNTRACRGGLFAPGQGGDRPLKRGTSSHLKPAHLELGSLRRDTFLQQERAKLFQDGLLVEVRLGLRQISDGRRTRCLHLANMHTVRTHVSAPDPRHRPKRSDQSDGKQPKHATQLGMATRGLCSVQKDAASGKRRAAPLSSPATMRSVASAQDMAVASW